MVKRTLIAVAVVALLATTVNAATNPYKHDDQGWPGTWTWTADRIDLCLIPVYMDVGIYVQVKDCHKREILLKQVDCPDGKEWPCYHDCEPVEVRSNFPVKLILTKKNPSSVIDKWDAYFDGTNEVGPGGGWETVNVCVLTWKTKIWNNEPDDKLHVGDILLSVEPK